MIVALQVVPRAITRLLAMIAMVLVGAHAAGKISAIYFGRDTLLGLIPMFDLTQEQNVPTFFAAAMMMFGAFLAGATGHLQRRLQSRESVYWFGLTILLGFLAFDELFQAHERLSAPTRAALDLPRNAYYAWTLPAAIVVLGVGSFFLRFVLRLPANVRASFFLAAGLYVAGAIGMELVGGLIDRDPHNLARVLVNMLEETLEMAGIIAVIHGILMYLDRLSVRLVYSKPVEPPRYGDPASA